MLYELCILKFLSAFYVIGIHLYAIMIAFILLCAMYTIYILLCSVHFSKLNPVIDVPNQSVRTV